MLWLSIRRSDVLRTFGKRFRDQSRTGCGASTDCGADQKSTAPFIMLPHDCLLP